MSKSEMIDQMKLAIAFISGAHHATLGSQEGIRETLNVLGSSIKSWIQDLEEELKKE